MLVVLKYKLLYFYKCITYLVYIIVKTKQVPIIIFFSLFYFYFQVSTVNFKLNNFDFVKLQLY